jgi:ATPase subunit of ABC transporter with duplicated ATPase domains
MILDGPTNHLDLESIISLNNALVKRNGTLIFGSHDVELMESLSDRVIEIIDGKVIDHQHSYTEFLRRRTEDFDLAVGA